MGAPTVNNSPGGAQSVRSASWTMTQGDPNGAPIGPDWTDWADRTVQFTGTVGAATMVLQGSNDGTNWQPLTSPSGTAISGTALTLRQVVENPLYMRPIVTGADGTTNVVCTLVAKRATLGRS